MKEIDFLPEWYKEGQRRRASVRTQYFILGGIFVALLTWNLVTGAAVSRARAKLSDAEARYSQVEDSTLAYTKLKLQIEQLQIKGELLDQIDSHIDVAAVLAELSYIIENQVVLKEIQFISERPESDNDPFGGTSGGIRIAKGHSRKNQDLPLGDIVFKLLIKGVAEDAADVAVLVRRLEESPFFTRVYPGFSRNIDSGKSEALEKLNQMHSESNKDEQVTDFEISCYLANYVEK